MCRPGELTTAESRFTDLINAAMASHTSRLTGLTARGWSSIYRRLRLHLRTAIAE
jgi:hypothetical protein